MRGAGVRGRDGRGRRHLQQGEVLERGRTKGGAVGAPLLHGLVQQRPRHRRERGGARAVRPPPQQPSERGGAPLLRVARRERGGRDQLGLEYSRLIRVRVRAEPPGRGGNPREGPARRTGRGRPRFGTAEGAVWTAVWTGGGLAWCHCASAVESCRVTRHVSPAMSETRPRCAPSSCVHSACQPAILRSRARQSRASAPRSARRRRCAVRDPHLSSARQSTVAPRTRHAPVAMPHRLAVSTAQRDAGRQRGL